MTATSTTTALTVDAVTDIVLDLLGAMLHEDVAALRARLLADGAAMPIDSLDLFDIVADFRAQTGLRIPVRQLRRATMRSVGAFAEFVVEKNFNG